MDHITLYLRRQTHQILKTNVSETSSISIIRVDVVCKQCTAIHYTNPDDGVKKSIKHWFLTQH
jgi:hypothetical protein